MDEQFSYEGLYRLLEERRDQRPEGSYTTYLFEKGLDKILKKVERSLDRSNTVFGRYMCQGKMPQAVRDRYESMEESPRRTAMLQNFDQAVSHPDQQDLENLKTTLTK